MGIDAHIERVDEHEPAGHLIALQIKTGPSHFKIKSDELIYYGSNEHLDYWIGHALPVVLVAHLPDSGSTYWVHVTEEVITRTAKRWKIAIPKSQQFCGDSKEQLAGVFDGSPSQVRLRKLTIDEPLMRHIIAGGKVSVDLEDWVNKSLGRTPVKVYVTENDGTAAISKEWYQHYVGYSPKALTEALFPWAAVDIDWDFYEEQGAIREEDSDYCEWLDDSDLTTASSTTQSDPGERISNGEDDDISINIEACTETDDHIYPYDEGVSGEVDLYRLQLTLNDLGDAYLKVADHLADSSESAS